jgi:hypothetical protein
MLVLGLERITTPPNFVLARPEVSSVWEILGVGLYETLYNDMEAMSACAVGLAGIIILCGNNNVGGSKGCSYE